MYKNNIEYYNTEQILKNYSAEIIESFAKHQILQKKMVEIFLWITNPRNDFETILVFGRYFYIKIVLIQLQLLQHQSLGIYLLSPSKYFLINTLRQSFVKQNSFTSTDNPGTLPAMSEELNKM